MTRKPERREFIRIPLEAEVEVSSKGEQLPTLNCRDISEGGMQLDFAELPEDSTLQLSLTLPEEPTLAEPSPPLVVTGEVAWRQPTSIGVRFSSLPHVERARLRAFLAGRARA